MSTLPVRDGRTGLEQALRAGLEADADWVWLVDESVTPQADALDELLAAFDRLGPLPEPVLLSGRVLTADGELDPDSLPFAAVRDPELVVAAIERRLLPVRVARRGSLLIRRSALECAGRQGGELSWSARLLKDGLGLLVPGSVAVRSGGADRGRSGADPGRRELLRLLASGALRPREKPWFAMRLFD